MKCKLCLKEATLLKKSHIIPNFLIKDVVDDRHRLALLTVSNGQLKDQIYDCWTLNPGETKEVTFQPDISIFSGYACAAY